MQRATDRVSAQPRSAHPNDLDRKRIERSLKMRKRYRYVSPRVMPVEGGYRIESPCCSRNIDPGGGTIDVALLLYDSAESSWQLFQKDHKKSIWVLHSVHAVLAQLLEQVIEDPERKFWQ